VATSNRADVEDTYAEAFRSVYAEFLITARDPTWLDHAVAAATGNASSTILCDCEAGLDRCVGPGFDESFATPDGRPGAIVQLHVPRFRKDRLEALERSLLVRISQNVLTCPTRASTCWTRRSTSSWAASWRSSATDFSFAPGDGAGPCGSCRSWLANLRSIAVLDTATD
jgi:hypothetical protein